MTEKPRVIWFTGLSGAGKTTLAEKLAVYLKNSGVKCELLDGDTVRNIFPQTGFTKKDRDEHVKRMGFLASMLERNGVTVVASFISPYRESRDFVRKMCRNFVEVYVSTSLEVCEKRDVKGLYKKARKGEITSFTGIDDPYEPPVQPEITIKTDNETVEESFEKLVGYLDKTPSQ
ncbi:adenylyl-sulfate kinase [bacterium]|nr:adenylyl-sulfate kinase [bacterium]